MDVQSTSNLPPLLPDDTVEENKKKGKRRSSTTYTPGGNPSEPSLPRHVRPEELLSSPTPVPRATSTPATESTTQSIPRRVFLSTPTHPSSLYQEITRVENTGVKIRAKDYSLIFEGNEVEKFIKRMKADAKFKELVEKI
ncbi:hypothetical protein O181_034446 [Austropuccinia psidii MF-1]|uniref:Uncharacterized protein n=1 Tax=Austropuccinia psidii MF-1 TaxID=1389203 RepID=A0A9Q3D0Q2_9BASI|nr:hypothetical protein [Austropuccinia psidii MF-1]